MVFGIDLGTTNSLIGTGDSLLTDLVSSSVDVSTKKQVARNIVGPDIVSSYKTDMSMGEEGRLSIACSAIILRELADTASKRYGEEVKDVVISVPAYFSTSQREAVYKAAQEAGLNLKILINEPTAAALYVCRDIKDLIVVYDLGGGTFDVSIVDSRIGNYAVVATDGIVLGGDNLDEALIEEVLKELRVPVRFRTKVNIRQLKTKMCLAKEEIQKEGVYKVDVDLEWMGVPATYTLTEEVYKRIIKEVFGRTILMTKNIISVNLPSYEKPKIVFVGGSSNCPYLKAMLKEEIEAEEIKCDISPDFVVAKGVALYAQLYYEGKIQGVVEDVTKRLCIEDNKGRSITIIESNSSVPCKASITVHNSTQADKLSLKLFQGDSMIAKNNEYIGTLVYKYGRAVLEHEGIVEVTVSVSADGVISLSAMEVLYGEDFRQSIELTAR